MLESLIEAGQGYTCTCTYCKLLVNVKGIIKTMTIPTEILYCCSKLGGIHQSLLEVKG